MATEKRKKATEKRQGVGKKGCAYLMKVEGKERHKRDKKQEWG